MSRAPLAVALVVALASVARAQELPAHPGSIPDAPLAFEPPAPAAHRIRLANGLTVYLVPDRTLPLVRARAYARTGASFDPKGKEGLAALTFRALRSCGAGKLGPDELVDRLDKLASSIDGDADRASATVDAWMPASFQDDVLALLADVLRRPRFDEKRLDKVRSDFAAEAAGDEDDAGKLALRRSRARIFGDTALSRWRTNDSVKAIGRDDVVAFARQALVPGRVVLAISGAFDRDDMRRRVERLFGDWKGEGTGWTGELPRAEDAAKTGFFLIDRAVSQATVQIARRGVVASDPDMPALLAADHIIGSGSFTSRIVVRVRADEGLAYSVGSELEDPAVGPGLVKIDFGSRAIDVSFALSLVWEESRRFVREGPTDEELAAAKSAIVQRFPGRFASAHDTAQAFAESDIAGLPDDHFATFRQRVSALDKDAVRRAAARLFDPSTFTVVIVGPANVVRANRERGTRLDELGKVEVDEE